MKLKAVLRARADDTERVDGVATEAPSIGNLEPRPGPSQASSVLVGIRSLGFRPRPPAATCCTLESCQKQTVSTLPDCDQAATLLSADYAGLSSSACRLVSQRLSRTSIIGRAHATCRSVDKSQYRNVAAHGQRCQIEMHERRYF